MKEASEARVLGTEEPLSLGFLPAIPAEWTLQGMEFKGTSTPVLMFRLHASDVTQVKCVSTKGSRLINEICKCHSGSGEEIRP